MKNLLVFFLLLFLSATLPFKCFATDFFSVVINEIAWMGTINSPNDEWMELYNFTDNPINAEGWVLKTADEKLKIILKGTIPAKEFYLLERTDDTSVPNITADLIYTGALNNNGSDLQLFNNLGNLIDEVNCSSGWFNGDNQAKKTMERINPLLTGSNSDNWQTSQNAGGTPRAKNSSGATASITPSPAATSSAAASPTVATSSSSTPTPTPTIQTAPETINYPLGIVFNEILPSPEGPDSENEWIVSTIQLIHSAYL